MKIRCTINGRTADIEVSAHHLMIDVLRDDLGLHSVKRSCDMQVCGACTVLLDGEPVSACCTLALEMRGREVTTLEGLAQDGRLHPLQEAFIRAAAFQCGFCTPGMILTAVALLRREPRPDRRRIVEWLDGNLCRCTGYAPIVTAIEEAAAAIPSAPGGERE